MIKALLFDVDGVLVNGERFSVHLERNYGIDQNKTIAFFKGEFKECILGKKDLKKILPKYLKSWGWKKSVEDFLNYWFKSEHSINEELMDYIKKLKHKGFQCYIATNQEKYRIEYLLDKMGFADNFDKIYASSHLGFKKPDLKFFEKLFTDLKNIEKDEILFWDNSIINVEAAQEFGIKAELYTDFADFENKMHLLIVNS
jgi:putative hydrolase of the HAD superfamily